jgi:hypothetical protein
VFLHAGDIRHTLDIRQFQDNNRLDELLEE